MSPMRPSDPDQLTPYALALEAELKARDLTIEKLRGQLAHLRRARFGRSSETLPGQLDLLAGELEADLAFAEARTDAAAKAAGVKGPGRKPRGPAKPLPEHLPREEVRHEAPACCPACGGAKLSVLGEDRREVLEYIPASFKVVVHVRPKVSCRTCEAIGQAPAPAVPLERSLPGPGLLAHVAASKFCDHLPLYRQSEIHARSGLGLTRAALAEWMGRTAFLLEPLAQAIGDHVRAGAALHADDTPVPVLDPGRGRTKTGRLWTLVRDERPWAGPAPPAAVYLYSPDRKGEHAQALLSSCQGFLHADGYAGFEKLYVPGGLEEVACWAHARRKLYEVHQATGSAAAQEALMRIAELFAIEAEVKGLAPTARLAQRQERSIPRLEALKTFLETTLGQVSRKSALAGAIRYATTRWEALIRFTADGRLEMTNNAAERAIRPLALGRKNYLFAGSDQGGERAAVFYTLITTAKLNGLDPEAFLADVIARIADHPARRLHELLPWNCTPPQHQKAA